MSLASRPCEMWKILKEVESRNHPTPRTITYVDNLRLYIGERLLERLHVLRVGDIRVHQEHPRVDAEEVAEAVEYLPEDGVGLSRRRLADGVLDGAAGVRGVCVGADQQNSGRFAGLASVICKKDLSSS